MAIGKDFWEDHHREDSGWLTGTRFDDLLRQFGLTNEEIQGKRILEIGVGKGFCTESFYKLARIILL